MSPRQDFRWHNSPQHHGIASIEFVMWLPLMMFLFWMVLAAGHIFLINCEVTAEVRQKAWGGRDEPWRRSSNGSTEGPLPSLPGVQGQFAQIGQVVQRYFHDNAALPPDWHPNCGLLAADHAKQIPLMIDLFRDLSTARAKHSVLAGVWDCRELPFETVAQRSEHKRLQPSKKFDYYTQPFETIDFSPLKQLASLAVGSLTQQGSAARSAYAAYQQSHAATLNGKRSELVRGIEQTNQQIGQLQQQLTQLRSMPLPDTSAISRLGNQLSALQQRLAILKKGLSQLDLARNLQQQIDNEAAADASQEN